MALDPKLLEILACPDDKGPLFYFENESSLYNPRLKRRYAVRDDIPIMLIDEAETVDDAEAAASPPRPRLMASSRPSRPSSPCPDAIHSSSGRLCAMPEQLDPTNEASGKVPAASFPAAADFDTWSRGHGGFRHRRERAAGGRHCHAPVPVTVLKHYRTPAFVGARTLAFALSYSGDTEETVEMARGALAAARVWSRSRVAGSSPRSAKESSSFHVPCPTMSRCPGSRLGALVARCSSCCSAWACCPRRTRGSCARSSSWQAPRSVRADGR